jgi:alanine racemase
MAKIIHFVRIFRNFVLQLLFEFSMYISNEFSRLEINLDSCLENYRYFRSRLEPSTRLLVLVKANAYGHGAVQFASLMEQAGADYLAVAYPVEGIELRQAGIKSPIMVLTAGTDSFEQIVNYGLEPGIPNMCSLKILCEVLEKRGITDFPVHIKMDTGMHRLGFMSDELAELMEFLASSRNVKVKSVYSHLAAADDPECDDFTLGQINLFKQNADRLTRSIGYKPLYHILNSAGIERFPQWQFDMVRLGIGIYGVSALPGNHLATVASFKCKVLQIKTLKPEDGTIGYGRHGKIAPQGTVIATIPVGYADGLDRHLSRGKGSFMVNGHRVPTIGNICMDMTMLDVTGLDVKVGDTVTIFGEEPSIAELADILGTIPYEILTSVPRRIERIIISRSGR